MGNSLENTRHQLPRVPLQRSHMGHISFLQQWAVTTQMKLHPPGQLIANSALWFFLGAGCVGAPCLSCTRVPGPEKKSINSREITLFAQSRHNEPLLLLRGNFISVQETVDQLRANLASRSFWGPLSSLLHLISAHHSPLFPHPTSLVMPSLCFS